MNSNHALQLEVDELKEKLRQSRANQDFISRGIAQNTEVFQQEKKIRELESELKNSNLQLLVHKDFCKRCHGPNHIDTHLALERWRTELGDQQYQQKIQEKRLANIAADLEKREKNISDNSDEINKIKEACEKKMAVERKSMEKEKKRYANEKVIEALGVQRLEYEAKVNALLDEKASQPTKPAPAEVIEKQESCEKKNWNLDTKARLFSGEDKPARYEDLTCSICKVNEVCVKYEPCKHVATCIDCAPRHIFLSESVSCQLCRKPIVDFEHVKI